MRETAQLNGNEIAIVGMAGRFPGANNVAELWRNLVAGVEAVTRFSDEQLRAAGVDPSLIANPHYVKAGAILDGIDQFDAGFFGFPPREAETMDPQHRLFLECAWETLEDGGCDPETFRGPIGVFAGSGFCRYLLQNLATNPELLRGLGDLQIAVGNERDALPTMVSYKLNLRGPSLAVQTFCSTSLVAIHLAAQSLLSFECDAALAGGVAIDLPQEKGYLFTPGGILSPDGRCRTFDARAEGSIMGNGVALVLLKRLEDALAAGDTVRAVIKGSAVNNDGIRRVGYTAPGLDGQAAVVVEALASGAVDPATVGYVETHGTATPLGDSVEIAALRKAFQSVRGRRTCALGSIKTNVGHLDRAAGVTGLIKTALALESRLLPPSLHCETPNPDLGLDDSPFYVNRELTAWTGEAGALRAGVSSFGVGGTNAHVVLEEPPRLPPTSAPLRPWQILTLSAKSANALEEATARLATYLRAPSAAPFADVAWTLATGRSAFSHRRMLVATSPEDAAEALERLDPRRVFSSFEERRDRPVAFLFPGLGDHYPGMARGLYESEPLFREQIDLCCELLGPELGLDLREVLWPAGAAPAAGGGAEIDLRRMLRRAPEAPDPAADRLQQTWLAQPALFVVELALARLWMSWGIAPQAMIGYSLGEYVAACLAGVFSLEDALRLVARRARLIQELPAGAMLGVPLSEEGVRPWLTSELSLAAVNGPAFSVVAGPVEAVEDLERRLAVAEVACRRLPTTHAFHSRMMEPIAERFAELVAATRREAPRRPWISNLTGGWIRPEEATDPAYWVRHLCETVRFGDGLAALAEEPGRVLLEIGPGQSLGSIARQQGDRFSGAVILPTLRAVFERQEDVPYLLTALGKLWLSGVRPDWPGFTRGEVRRRVPLPTYPFQRRRYWVEPGKGGPALGALAPGGKKTDPADWFYLPAWRPVARPAEGPAEGQQEPADWLAFVTEGDGLAELLVGRLRRGGTRVVTVRPGGGFARTGPDDFVLAPRSLADYERLLAEAGAVGRIVHFWSAAPAEEGGVGFDAAQAAGFGSLLCLAQALGRANVTDPVRLCVVSSGVFRVTGAETLVPERATLAGPCRVIPQEYLNVLCRHVDITRPASGGWQEERLAGRLAAELTLPGGDLTVAWRGDDRWVLEYTPVRLEGRPERQPRLREEGVYLITGGLGGVGLILAEHLARDWRARVVLMGRTPLPPRERWEEIAAQTGPADAVARRVRKLLELETAGAEILALSADVADPAALRAALDRTRERFGALHGVIHAAGVADERSFRTILEVTPEQQEEQLRPKAGGVLALEEALRGEPLDFVLLFSSISAVLGGLGYYAYAAANAFLDAFVESRSGAGSVPWLSVAWDSWPTRDDQPSPVGGTIADLVMTRAEGGDALERVLTDAAGPRIVHSLGDLQARIDQWVKLEGTRASAGKPTGPRHERPDLSTRFVAPEGETESGVAAIWEELLGIEPVGAHDDFFELGGHSLLATQLFSRLRARFSVDLPLRSIFEAPTVAGLAGLIVEAAPGEASTAPPPLLRTDRTEEIPVSFAQQRLWFLDRLEPGNPFYNICLSARIVGELRSDVLRRSLGEIVRRHEALRTTFREIDGRPVQHIAPPSDPLLPLADLRHLPEEERPAEALRLDWRHHRQAFDLAAGPLLRCQLARMAGDEHRLFFTIHHSVADDWSIGVFLSELVAIYEAFRAGRPSPLPELPVQYADFACWQRQWLRSEELERQLGYWRKQLAGGLPVLQLPFDRPRPAVQTHRGTTLFGSLSASQSAGLRELAQRQGVTLFMAMLALFKTLLFRYSGQEDATVGSPIANRSQVELEALIGYFANTLVLRAGLGGDPSFAKLLERVREVTLGAYAHQDLPFEKLVEELRPERSLGHTPLFQVAFSLQNAPHPGWVMGDVSIVPLPVDSGTAKFDLELMSDEREEGLPLILEYSTDLFDPATMERLLGHLQVLLAGVVADPERRLSALALLTEAEQRELTAWNETARDLPLGECVHRLFEIQVARTPDSTAISCGGHTLSYGELNQRANRWAWELIRRGVGPDSVVALLSGRGIDFLVAVLAVFKAGGAYLPLDPAHPEPRLRSVLELAGARLVLCGPGQSERLETAAAAGPELLPYGVLEAARGAESDPPPRALPGNLAYVIFTSGSTGTPKGAMVEHRGMLNHLFAKIEDLGLGAADTVAQNASQCFDISVWQLLAALLVGGRVHVVDDEAAHDPRGLLAEVERGGVTILETVPSLLRVLLDEALPLGAASPLARLRWMVPTGEALPPRLCRDWLAAFPGVPLLNAYGPTECSDDVAHHPLQVPPAADAAQVPIGRPVVNMRLHVLDVALRRAPVGVAGELWVAGTGVGRGYLNDPARTAEAFVPDPWSGTPGARLYRTGDLVRRRAGGEIEFLGRIDHQVKLRGFRIELGEIEAVLAAHPGVSAAVVLVRTDLPGGEQLAAFVTFVAGGPERPGADELRARLRDRLPDYMVPTAFAFLDSLPLTPNGKVDRRALSCLPVETDGAGSAASVPPRTPTEVALAGLWAELLEIEPGRVGAGDGFFALGGHSLLATRLVSRLRAERGIELPLRAVFEAPVLEDLAARVDAAAGSAALAAAVPPLRPVPRERPLELSHAQQRLWFLCQLDPDSPLYDDFTQLRLAGDLDVLALEGALTELRGRHEILRTTFPLVDGRPVQAVAPAGGFRLPLVDLAGLAAGKREDEVERVMRREGLRASDPATGPLLRVYLLRLAPREHALLVGLHHILTDAWSQEVLVRELSVLYDAFQAGRPSPLPALPIQYGDYAAWQRSWLEGPVLQEQIAWWKERLDGAPPLLDLPTDHPRPAVRSWRGASCSFELAADTAGLHSLAEQEGATLFMLLLTSLQALLGRWSGQTDVVVGSPIANRTRAELEGLIGFFVNTLALRTDLDGEPTVRELLGRVRETTLGAYAHQDLPFERLVEELRLERNLGHSPLFQVLLILQNEPPAEVRFSGLDVRTLELDMGMARFELMLTVVEERGRLTATLGYSTDLFEAPTLSRFAGHLRTLLAAMAEAPERKIAEIEILSAPERQQLLQEWTDSAVAAEVTGLCLHELVGAQAWSTPAAPAVTFRDETLTCADLEARANRLAHRLRALGCGPESLVAVALERSTELVVALLAVLKAGGAYVPLDPEYPAERLSFMLTDARPMALVTMERFRKLLPVPAGLPAVCLDTEREVLERESAAPPVVPGDVRRLAYVIYTSGSTGRPKGVSVTHAALVNFLQAMARRVPLGPGDVLLAVTTFSFDIAGLELYLPLITGARVEILGREEAASGEGVRDALVRSGATLLQATPATWRLLLAAGWEGDSRLVALCGGEALPPDLADRLIERCGVLWNVYGPTETTIWSAAQRLDRSGGRVTLGRPLDNQHLLVLDRFGAPAPFGAPGELLIGGDGVARGYLGRPELTAERFVPDPYPPAGRAGGRLYRTGDLVRSLADGRLEFLGRVDHQVKVRGFRIELGEVETALASCPGVRQAVVTVWRGTGELEGGDRLAAYVVPEPGVAPAPVELRALLRERLPEPMLPAAWTFLEALPLTPNGKIDRRALPAPSAADGVARDGSAEPRTALERLLAGLWRDLLGVHRVGPEDSFFELGGDSIHGAILINRLQEKLGRRVPVRLLFQAPTLAGLAAAIEGLEKGPEQGAWEIVPRPREAAGREELPLSFAQQRIWFAERTHPGAYNTPAALRLEGRLDLAALERAASEIARRHEVLRSTFVEIDGAPVQRIAAPGPVPLPLVDVTALPAAESRQAAGELIAGEAERPFDLAHGPLLRWLLVRLAPEEHVVLLTLHHIVSDAWTGNVLTHEIGVLYRAFAAGGLSPLHEPAVQYGDFAAWQKRWLESGALDAELAWWRETLRGPLSVLQLPIDRPRPARPSQRGTHLRLPLAPELSSGLRELARRRGATLFAALLAGFKALLFRRTRQEDILVGTAVAGRSRREIEGLIGAFVNMLVLRTDLSGDPTFLELLDRVRDTATGAFAHQDLPFDRLVEALRLSRDPAQSPLFQVAFGLDNVPERELELPGVTLRPLELRSESVRFDLTLWVLEERDGLSALWTYSTDLFHEATITHLHAQYEELLRSAVAAPEERLGELALGAARRERSAEEDWGFVPGLRSRRRPVSVAEEAG